MAGAVVAHGQDSSYSSKSWLYEKKIATAPVQARVAVAKTAAQPAYAASSKPWLRAGQPAVSGGINTPQPRPLLAGEYDSKKSMRGERGYSQPAFQVAPLK